MEISNWVMSGLTFTMIIISFFNILRNKIDNKKALILNIEKWKLNTLLLRKEVIIKNINNSNIKISNMENTFEKERFKKELNELNNARKELEKQILNYQELIEKKILKMKWWKCK